MAAMAFVYLLSLSMVSNEREEKMKSSFSVRLDTLCVTAKRISIYRRRRRRRRRRLMEKKRFKLICWAASCTVWRQETLDEKPHTTTQELFIHFAVCLKKLCAFLFAKCRRLSRIPQYDDEATTNRQGDIVLLLLSSLYDYPNVYSFLSFCGFLRKWPPKNSLSFSTNGEREIPSHFFFLLFSKVIRKRTLKA